MIRLQFQHTTSVNRFNTRFSSLTPVIAGENFKRNILSSKITKKFYLLSDWTFCVTGHKKYLKRLFRSQKLYYLWRAWSAPVKSELVSEWHKNNKLPIQKISQIRNLYGIYLFCLYSENRIFQTGKIPHFCIFLHTKTAI